MAKVSIIFIVVCILAVCFAQRSKSRLKTARRPRRPKADPDIYVNETIRLITDGDGIIDLNNNHKDIILVIGNTGAGKTTITKFITDVENLESYDAEDRFLIRDKHHKISVNSTIISKTIFPELFIDNASNSAFYDLPGFSDTRNASVEIANAWFMKKVADHAHRVKLLFVVNYSSLRNGETRTDFKTFLEHATALVKDPAKFKASIALVATKVESTRTSAKIIQGIASFLQTTKGNLEEVMDDDDKRRAAEDLIDAFVCKDSTGAYNRISFFKQPEDEGPLTDLPETMKQKEHIEKVIYENIIFAPKTAGNFGFSISPAAKLLISKIADRMNRRITGVMTTIGKQFTVKFQSKVNSSSWGSIGSLMKAKEVFVNLSNSLASISKRQDFIPALLKITLRLHMVDAINTESTKLDQRQEILEFLEQISGNEFPAPILDWSHPIHKSVKVLTDAISQKLVSFSIEMENQIDDISKNLLASFSIKLSQIQSNKEKLLMFEKYSQSLDSLNGKLSGAKSVNNFVKLVKLHLGLLDSQVVTTGLVLLNDDMAFDPTTALSLLSWVTPFEKLLTKIRNEMFTFKVQLMESQNEEDRKLHNQTMTSLVEKFDQEKKEQEKRIDQMKTDHQNAVKAIENQMIHMQNSHKQQMQQMQLVLKQNQQMIEDLRHKLKNQNGLMGYVKPIAVGAALGAAAG